MKSHEKQAYDLGILFGSGHSYGLWLVLEQKEVLHLLETQKPAQPV